jgi:hypothetical protein
MTVHGQHSASNPNHFDPVRELRAMKKAAAAQA